LGLEWSSGGKLEGITRFPEGMGFTQDSQRRPLSVSLSPLGAFAYFGKTSGPEIFPVKERGG
jgi:hypothetical protein